MENSSSTISATIESTLLATESNRVKTKEIQDKTRIFSSQRYEAYWNEKVLILIDLPSKVLWAIHPDEEPLAAEEFIDTLFDGDGNFSQYIQERCETEFIKFLVSRMQKLVELIVPNDEGVCPVTFATSLLFAEFLSEYKNNKEVLEKTKLFYENAQLSFPKETAKLGPDFGLKTIGAELFYDSKFTRVVSTPNSILAIHFVPRVVFFKFNRHGKKLFMNEIKLLKDKGFHIEKKRVSTDELKFDLQRLSKDDFKVIRIGEQLDEYEASEKFKRFSEKMAKDFETSLNHCQS